MNLSNRKVNAKQTAENKVHTAAELNPHQFETCFELFKVHARPETDNDFLWKSAISWFIQLGFSNVFDAIIYRTFNGMSEKGELTNKHKEETGQAIVDYFVPMYPLYLEDDQNRLLEGIEKQFENKLAHYPEATTESFVVKVVENEIEAFKKAGYRVNELPDTGQTHEDYEQFLYELSQRDPDLYGDIVTKCDALVDERTRLRAELNETCESIVMLGLEDGFGTPLMMADGRTLYFIAGQMIKQFNNTIERNATKEAFAKKNDRLFMLGAEKIQDKLNEIKDMSERTVDDSIDHVSNIQDGDGICTGSEIAQHSFQDATGQEKHLSCV